MQVDWFTLLLIFFFIILPLLQHLTGKRRPPETGEGEEEGWEGQAPHGRTPERAAPPEEWDPWLEHEQVESTREARNAWEELGLDGLFREPRPEPRPEPLPQRAEPAPSPAPRPAPVPNSWDEWSVEQIPPPPPVRVPRPPPVVEMPVRTVALERLEVDREAEHVRFRRTFQAERPTTDRSSRGSRAGALLRHSHSIRQAIVLAEVLGPPRALRGQDER